MGPAGVHVGYPSLPNLEAAFARVKANGGAAGCDHRTTWGWFEYFKQTSYTTVFGGLDGWIRRRLRRILLKRHKRPRHSGLGTAHQRWPNTLFAAHGFFSMARAHVRFRQSVVR